MDSHQHAQDRLSELRQQAATARQLRQLKPHWSRLLATQLVRFAQKLDQDTVQREVLTGHRMLPP